MQSLLKQLWFQSDNAKLPIHHMGFQLMEVGKFTGHSRDAVREYLYWLMDNGYMELISKEPLLFQFTEKGRLIKSVNDINVDWA